MIISSQERKKKGDGENSVEASETKDKDGEPATSETKDKDGEPTITLRPLNMDDMRQAKNQVSVNTKQN